MCFSNYLVVLSASYIWHITTADQEPGDKEQIPGLRVLESHSKNTLEAWTKQNWPGFSQACLAFMYTGFSNDSELNIHPEPSCNFCTSCSLDGYTICSSQLTNWKHHSAHCNTTAKLGEAAWTHARSQPMHSGPSMFTRVENFILFLQIS